MSTAEKYTENDDIDKEDEFVETRCGVGSCRPSWLQRANNPKILCLCICMYITVQGKRKHLYMLDHSFKKYSKDIFMCDLLIKQDNMILVMRKPDFRIRENKDADQLRGIREADQRLCFRYTDSTIPLLPKSEISSI